MIARTMMMSTIVHIRPFLHPLDGPKGQCRTYTQYQPRNRPAHRSSGLRCAGIGLVRRRGSGATRRGGRIPPSLIAPGRQGANAPCRPFHSTPGAGPLRERPTFAPLT
jgi:hypothetical protein